MYENTCYWLLIIILQQVSVSMIGKFIVYKFTVHCTVYSKLLLLKSLQVYSTSDSTSDHKVYKFIVHQIVYSKLLVLTSHWSISELLHFFTVDSVFLYYTFFTVYMYSYCTLSTNQRAITLFQPIKELLHFFSQSESYYTFFTVYMYRNNTFISLLLNYGLWYSHMIRHAY